MENSFIGLPFLVLFKGCYISPSAPSLSIFYLENLCCCFDRDKGRKRVHCIHGEHNLLNNRQLNHFNEKEHTTTAKRNVR